MLIFVMGVFLGSAPRAQAGTWGESWETTIFDNAYEEIMDKIQAILTGALKQAVAQVMNMQISVLIGGGGGSGQGPLFIQNWQVFLVVQPQQFAETVLNDFFTATTRGRTSSSSYAPAIAEDYGYEEGDCAFDPSYPYCTGGEDSQASMSSARQAFLAQEGVVATARAATEPSSCPDQWRCTTDSAPDCSKYGAWQEATVDKSCPAAMCADSGRKACVPTAGIGTSVGSASQGVGGAANSVEYAKSVIAGTGTQVDLSEYCASSSVATTGNVARIDFRCMEAFFGKPMNNPIGYSIKAKEVYQGALAQKTAEQQTRAIVGGGYQDVVDENGNVKYPAGSVGDLYEKVKSISFDNLTNADTWAEVITDAATTVITSALTQGINTGLNYATSQISEGTGGRINLNLTGGGQANTNWNNQSPQGGTAPNDGADTNPGSNGTAATSLSR